MTKKAAFLLSGLLAAISCTTSTPTPADVGQADVNEVKQGEVLFPDTGPNTPDVLDIKGPETTSDTVDTQQLLCDPGEGCFLDKCDDNKVCQSGWCVQHMGESVCSETCQEECPAGWTCQQVAGTDPDVVYICVSSFANLCRPCSTNDNCKSVGGAEDACINYGTDGNFCGGPCGEGESCPWGFSCKEVLTVEGSSLQQCVNDTGECPCTESSVALGLTTPCNTVSELGSCPGKRTCTEEGLSTCNAPEPTVESCNGVDDDCDDETDEPDLVEGNYVNLCDDDNDCTEDKCMGEGGCVNEVLGSGPCEDGDPCTVADHCVAGTCIGDPVECDDDDPCTDDVCTETGGCEYPSNTDPCDDGNPCTLSDQCTENGCTGTAVDCECLEDADCGGLEDGDMCNGTLVCDTSGLPYKCRVDPETVVSCPDPEDDNAFCLKANCDPGTGECSFTPNHEGFLCDNADACTVSDKCSEGVCAGGSVVNCNDGNPCTDDSCEAEVGCVTASLEDGSYCGLVPGWKCIGGECVCAPNCQGKECGPDGCGGSCGECDLGQDCNEGNCDSAPYLVWAKCFGQGGETVLRSMTVDVMGSVFATGYFDGSSLDFGGGDLPTKGGQDAFLVKLDTNGEYMWSIGLGGDQDDRGRALSVLPTGRLFLGGHFQSSAFDAGGGILDKMPAGFDVFMAAFEASGQHVWSKSFGGGVALASSSNWGNRVLLSGTGSTLSFGADQLDTGVFLASMTESGTHLWSGGFGGSTAFGPMVLDVGSSGHILFGGNYKGGPLFIGAGTVPESQDTDAFVALLNKEYGHLWSHRFGGENSDSAFAGQIDSAGSVVVAGVFYSESISFGGQSLQASGYENTWVAKLDVQGGHVWSTSLGTGTVYGLAIDGEDHVYVGGAGWSKLPNADSLARLDDEGQVLWSTSFGKALVRSVAVDSVGDIYVATTGGTGEFGGPKEAGFEDGDICLAKFTLNVPGCNPKCELKECGESGCGGLCGTCGGPQEECLGGVCVCQSGCDGKKCGGDGCGGSCGECDLLGNDICVKGKCICLPDCADKECGWDGCDGSCGICNLENEFCVQGSCVCPGGMCAGSCCKAGEICADGECCQPTCEGKACGGDGCGGSCGQCGNPQDVCVEGTCMCIPECGEKECGTDGCEGTCGVCGPDKTCNNGFCKLPGYALWSMGIGGLGNDIVRDIRVTSEGPVLVVGTFDSKSIQIGPLALGNSGNGMDCFLAKIGPQGDIDWVTSWGGNGDDRCNAIEVDSAGRIVVVGSYNSTDLAIGNSQLPLTGIQDSFIAFFDGSGKPLNGIHLGGAEAYTILQRIRVNGQKAFYVVGNIRSYTLPNSVIDFGGAQLDCPAIGCHFMARIDENGTVVWKKAFSGGVNLYSSKGLEVSADGHPVWYLDDSISSFGGTVDFGGGPLAGHGGWDVIVVELGQEGEHHWSHVFGGDMSEQAGGLGVDNNGNLSLTGMTHSKSISFGGASLPGQSTMDAFVALLGKDGSHIWSQRLETNGIHLPLSIAVGDDGGIVVGAIFNVSSPFQIGDTVFSGGGSHLFKISVTGAHEWQKLLSNMTVTYPLTIVMSPTASIFVGGEFQESGPDFGNGPISFVGGIDGYVAAFGH